MFSPSVSTDGSTGTETVYTKLDDYEIIFHVAPFLPHSDADKQQVRSTNKPYLIASTAGEKKTPWQRYSCHYIPRR
jgi:hypothetical protein